MTTHNPRALKPPKTYDEQIDLLISRGLIILDRETALRILRNLNYYRFTAYLLPFRVLDSEDFVPGTTLERVSSIYEFDRRFRNLIMAALESIEIMLRSRIAYYHATVYGPEGYMHPCNFENAERHADLVDEFKDVVARNSKSLIVYHHIRWYEGRFPIWVAVEFFSFGMLSKFYANLKAEDRKRIAKEMNQGPEHLKSWSRCFAYLRNLCAHYSRLYYQTLTTTPRFPSNAPVKPSSKVFDIVYVMKDLYPDAGAWHESFLRELQALVGEYGDAIDLGCIGFPANWYQLLA